MNHIIESTNDAQDMASRVQAALDPNEMCRTFGKHLRTWGNQAYEVQRCQISRVRYRQSARAVIQYSLELMDRKSGHTKEQTVTGTIYSHKDVCHIADKLKTRGAQVTDSLRTFESVGAIPSLNMLVQVFPFDRRLTALPRVVAGLSDEYRTAIEARLGDETWRIVKCQAVPVRYRAGLAAVVRYVVDAEQRGDARRLTRSFFAKVYRHPEDGWRAHQILSSLRSQVSTSFCVGEPVVYSEVDQTLLLEGVAGPTLEDILLLGRADHHQVRDRMRDLAARLAVFHQGQCPTHRCHSSEDQLSNLHRSMGRLRWACPELSQEIDDIAIRICRTPDVAPGPTHRDLKPEHVFFAGGDVSVIDWDSYAAADPVLDVASLVARLFAMPVRHARSPDRFRHASEHFCRDYFARVPKSWQARFAEHYSGALLEVAVGFFGRQEPRWRETISSLVKESRCGSWTFQNCPLRVWK